MNTPAAFAETALAQYRLVQSARSVLLDYCSTIRANDLTASPSHFGGGNIRNLLVHIANVYGFWLGTFALRRSVAPVSPDSVQSVRAIRPLYDRMDLLTADFIRHFSDGDATVTGDIPGRSEPVTTTPLALLTHVITHEFHHKGQIMSMTRQLGYTPPDADIIRFS